MLSRHEGRNHHKTGRDTTVQMSNTGAVILAAGVGSRMGNRPKCLLELDGVPLIRRLALALNASAVVGPPLVVVGQHADMVAAALQGTDAAIALNPAPQEGQEASLRIGLAGLSAALGSVMVLLADQPLIDASDIQDLLNAYQGRPTGAEVVQPCVDGLPGNPVVFSARVMKAILERPSGFGCRQWQSEHPEAVFRWITSNTHYRTDVDTPEDVDAFAQSTGRFLRWPEDPLPS